MSAGLEAELATKACSEISCQACHFLLVSCVELVRTTEPATVTSSLTSEPISSYFLRKADLIYCHHALQQ